jgi:hypothetical protein
MAGLSVQSESKLLAELKRLQKVAGAADQVSTKTQTFKPRPSSSTAAALPRFS